MAGCGAYSKIEGFAFLPVTCFSMALATFVSQNMGARQPARVRKGMRFGAVCCMAASAVIGLSIYVGAPMVIGLFSSEPEVIAYGVRECHVAPLFYALLAFSHCASGILRGLGQPMIPMAVMLLDWCLFRITYITVAVRLLPVIEVIFWAYPLTWSISTVLFIVWLYREDKRLR